MRSGMSSGITRRASWATLALVVVWAAAGAPLGCATSTQPAQDAGPPPQPDGGHKKDGMPQGENCGAVGQKCCAPPTECQTGAFCNETERVCKNQHPPDIGQPCASSSSCSSGICGYTQISDASSMVPDGNGTPPPNSTGCTVGCNNTTECTPGWTCQQLITSGGVCVCNWAPEICDGMDNNCDGIVDNEPEADNYCTMMDNGIPQKCVKGGCRCVTTCEGSCVDPMTDDNNCGKCGHACKPMVERCVGGSCGCAYTECKGQCVNTGGSDNMNCGGCGAVCDYTCTMGSCGPTTLATGVTSPASIAADGTNVYWMDYSGSFEPQIQYCPLSGCGSSPSTLATSSIGFGSVSSVNQIALGPSNVFFSDGELDIDQCPKPPTGCAGIASTYSTSGSYDAALASGSSDLGWSVDSDTIYSCALGASCPSPTTVGTTIGGSPSAVAISGSTIYWIMSTFYFPASVEVFSAPVGGGASTEICSLSTYSSEVGAMVVAGGFVYWTGTYGGNVYSCPATGSMATATTYVADTNEPYGIATDGTNLYWAENSASGSIMKCALGATCSSPTTLVSAPYSYGLAVSSTQVFWTAQGTTPGVFVFHN